MIWLKFAISAYIALVLQTAFAPVVFPDLLRPWFLVVLANLYLLSRTDQWTLPIVWMIGLMGDLTSISPLGTQAVAFSLYGLLILKFRPVLFTDSLLAHGVTAGIGVVIIYSLYGVISLLTKNALPLPLSVVDAVGQALMTGMVAAMAARLLLSRKRHLLARR